MPNVTPEEFEKHLIDPLDRIQLQIGGDDFCPCTNLKEIDGRKRPCTFQYEGIDKKTGKALLWYGADCTLPSQKFCEACLLYWLLAVARNVALALKRTEAFKKAGR